MAPSMPLPLLSSIVRAPAGSFICQVATGWLMAALAGDAIDSAPASVTTTASNPPRSFAFPLLFGRHSGARRPADTGLVRGTPPGSSAWYASRMELEALDHVGLTVNDVARSVRWYQEVLGLRRAHQEAWGDLPAVLEANGSGVALFPREAEDPPPAADPLRHVAFRTSRRGLEAAKAELRARGIAFEERDYGVAWSVYLPDPDGHLVEITTYEVPRG
jgi:catechol 2,3-dioxygenase-like lactoylglutathione lyase family enzyme